MAIAYSRLTERGQVSIPKQVRQRLGVGPGSILAWEEDGERVVVRSADLYTSKDIYRALFEDAPEFRPLEELKDGVRQYVKSRHARR